MNALNAAHTSSQKWRKPKATAAGPAAFTLVELLVAVGIVAVLSALLISAGHNVRDRSDRIGCINNLKQISAASIAYSAEHQGQWPPNLIDKVNGNKVYMEALLPYFGRVPTKLEPDFLKSPFICPADRSKEPDGGDQFKGVWVVRSRGLSYGQNYFLQATTTTRKVGGLRPGVQYPAELVLYMDFHRMYLMDTERLADGDRLEKTKERHGKMVNAGFADGSVRQVDIDNTPTTLPSRFWQGRDQ